MSSYYPSVIKNHYNFLQKIVQALHSLTWHFESGDVNDASVQSSPDLKSSVLDNVFWQNISYHETQEFEFLPPPYSCTVCKMGYLNVKQYMDKTGIRSRKRSWRKRYLVLWGTSLSLYYTERDHKCQKDPILKLTMQNAKAVPALDYIQRLNVVRLKIFDGAQFLLRTSNSYEIVSWIEQLQASINISLDLDERSMPKFHTLPQRGRWRQGQVPIYWQQNYTGEMVIRTELEYVLDVVFSLANDQGTDLSIV